MDRGSRDLSSDVSSKGGRPPKLGELAVDAELASREEVLEGLAFQEDLAAIGLSFRIGRILLALGYLDRSMLFALLAAQAEANGGKFVDSSVESAGWPGLTNASLAAVLARRVDEGTLERIRCAVELLGAHGLESGLAEILVESSLLSPEEATRIEADSPGAPSREGEAPDLLEDSGLLVPLDEGDGSDRSRRYLDARFGRLAVRHGILAEEVVRDALYAQVLVREMGLSRCLGELLVARGALDDAARRRILDLQAGERADIRWSEDGSARLEGEEEVDLARRLVEEGHLSAEAVDECLFVRSVMRGFGIERDLVGVLRDRRMLDKEVLKALRPDAALAEERLVRRRTGDRASAEAAPDDPLLLGRLAAFNGLVSAQDVEACLGVQADLAARGYPLPLGRILVHRRLLGKRQLAKLLEAQARGRGEEPGSIDLSEEFLKLTESEDDAIVARAAERVAPADRERCRELQAALAAAGMERRLGEIYLELGLVPRDAVDDVLAGRDSVRRRLLGNLHGASETDPLEEVLREEGMRKDSSGAGRPGSLEAMRRLRLGRLAIHQGKVAREQVREALVIQLRLRELGADLRMGRILVDRGWLEKKALARLLDLQRVNRAKLYHRTQGLEAELPERERELVGFLAQHGILRREELAECIRVRQAATQLGLSVELFEVLVEREAIDREVLEAIDRRLDDLDEESGVLRSEALQAAYQHNLTPARFNTTTRVSRRPDLVRKTVGDVPLSSRRLSPRRSIALVAGAAAAAVLSIAGVWSRAPVPAPPAASPPRVAPVPEGRVTLRGTIRELAFYPRPGAQRRVTFDFLLETRDGWIVVRGEAGEDAPAIASLRRAAEGAREVAVRGQTRDDPTAPSVALPDRSRTRRWLDFEAVDR